MPVPCGCCPIPGDCMVAPAVPQFAATLASQVATRTNPAPRTFLFTNFAGSGIDVTIKALNGSLVVSANPGHINELLIDGVAPTSFVEVTFSAPVRLRSFGFSDFDQASQLEQAHTFNPKPRAAYGQDALRTCFATGAPSPVDNPIGCLASAVAGSDERGGALFSGEIVTLLSFRMSRPVSTSGEYLTELAFDLTAPETRPVYSCRDAAGVLHWYGADGVEVAAALVMPCVALVPPVPLAVSNLVMTNSFLGDDGGTGENLCAITPAASSMTGFTPAGPGCFDPATAGVKSMTWNGPVTGVQLAYNSNGSAASGAALFAFAATGVGTVNWTANGTPMLPGETRDSLPLVGGGHATLTYLAPGGLPASGAPRFDGGPNIRLGPAAVQAFTPQYPFRIDFYA